MPNCSPGLSLQEEEEEEELTQLYIYNISDKSSHSPISGRGFERNGIVEFNLSYSQSHMHTHPTRTADIARK